MGCCGKVVKKVGNIARGYTKLATEKAGLTKKYKFTDSRIRECQRCDESTWMTKLEYGKWLISNGIEVLENFSQLEMLSKLPKYELDSKRRSLFCRICKCFVPAAARVPNKKCFHPQGNKWERI